MCPVQDSGSPVCHANTSLMTSSCRTAVSTYIGSMREASFSTLSTEAKRPFERKTRGQLCSEGPLECGGRCRVRIAGSYCLRCRICKLPSLTLRESETVQPTLNVMSANGRNSLRVSCPLGECGEGSLCPHAVQVALATDPWGVVQVHPTSNGLLADDQGHDQAANSCRYVEERRGEEKLAAGGVRASPRGQRWCATNKSNFQDNFDRPITCTT